MRRRTSEHHPPAECEEPFHVLIAQRELWKENFCLLSDPPARHVEAHGFERFDRCVPFVPVDAELEPSTRLEPVGRHGSRLEIDEPMVRYADARVVRLLHEEIVTPRAFR